MSLPRSRATLDQDVVVRREAPDTHAERCPSVSRWNAIVRRGLGLPPRDRLARVERRSPPSGSSPLRRAPRTRTPLSHPGSRARPGRVVRQSPARARRVVSSIAGVHAAARQLAAARHLQPPHLDPPLFRRFRRNDAGRWLRREGTRASCRAAPSIACRTSRWLLRAFLEIRRRERHPAAPGPWPARPRHSHRDRRTVGGRYPPRRPPLAA